ncbi:MAG TPA: galactonate dehydratase [Opitutaceae bacterium]|nr:galactonate dehydratase [Candidatus Hydrogenedentota bacterium]HRJ46049.1 galactonate dehydratase [Opitutaceae bacterium]
MKITHLETIHVRPRWLLVRIHTNQDHTGWGEATLEGRSLSVETMVHEMGRWLVGQDPRRIEQIWQHLHRGGFYRGGGVHCSALSGIDMALWDLLGKSLGAPVHQLLGGRVRDRIRLYAWTDAGTSDDYVNAVRDVSITRGLTAFKYNATGRMRPLSNSSALSAAVDRFAGLRRAAGPAVDIATDFHGRLTHADAKRLVKLLEPHQPFFIEEPVVPGDTDALRDIAASTSVPIAAGERLFTRWEFQPLIERRAVAIVQPDTAHAGGISETRRIASMAESRDILFAPHCPLGPVALAACLHLDAVAPNFLIQEHVTLGESLLRTPFIPTDGYLSVPEAPGLGIEIDEAKLAAERFDGVWDNPYFTAEDGGFAEW